MKVCLVAIDYVKLSTHTEEEDDGNTAKICLNTSLEFKDKRAKRLINEKLKLKADIETIKDDLTETRVQVEKVDLNASISETNHKPKINTKAVNIEDVYSVHDLVSEDILESLTMEVVRIFNNPDENTGTCNFVTKILDTFEDINSDKNKTACQIWLYVDCLIQFYISTIKTITTKKYRACPYSELASNEILDKYIRTYGKKTSNYCERQVYVLYLSAFRIKFKLLMNITSLAEQLHMTTKRVKNMARVLRFTVNGTTVSLKLPLPIAMEGRYFRYLKELQKALILLSTLSTCLWAQGLCGGPDVPNHGLPPVRLTFHTARQLWDTVHVGHCLFVALPSSIPEGSRESFLALLEAAEEQLKCQYVILVFEKTRPDLTKLIHTFMFLGFTVLSPTATILPPSLTANNVCMLYRIE